MFATRRTIAALVCSAFAVISSIDSAAAKDQHAAATRRPVKNVALDELVTQLKNTIIQAQDQISDQRLPPLKDVQITLQTELKMTGGLKLGLFVISLGETVSSDKTQSIKITLKPPKPGETKVAAITNWSQQLAAAIVSVAATVAASTAPPKLELDCVSATMKFVASSDTSAGGKVIFLPITIDLEGSVSPSNTQEAVLTFGEGCEAQKKEETGDENK